MTEPLSAARLGIWDDLLPGFQATGWIDGDGHPIPQASRLLLALRRGPDAEGGLERLAGTLQQAPELASAALDQLALGDALVAVVGASRALTQTVAEHPDWLREAVHGQGPESEEPERPPHHEERLLALRRFVRRGLLRVAVRDLLGLADMPQVGRELSDIA
ncbi:MAG: hypothetical protein M3N51_01105, partial [Actinomycetota bacterium]|nr:hypothetical protein [Actinomycetota bacterium]